MLIVGVKHHKDDEKVYWFKTNLTHSFYVSNGDRVICNTRLGKQEGIAVTDVIAFYNNADVKFVDNNINPDAIRSIFGVYKTVEIDKIIIPRRFLNSKPSEKKLKDRVREFITTRKFDTKVEIDSGYNLKDGYTAYLIAKENGLTRIECFIKDEEIE